MSLILEALKKSEDKRRLGAAPDLATPFSAPRRRSWVWPLAVLIVIAGAIGWVLRPASPPPQSATSVAPAAKSNAPAAGAAPTSGQKTGAPLHSVTGNNDLVQTAPPPAVAKPPVRPAGGQFVPGQPDANTPAPAETPKNGREVFQAMLRQGAERAGQAEQMRGQAAQMVAKTPAQQPKANPKVNAARTASAVAPPPATAPAPVASAPSAAAPTAPVAATPVAPPATVPTAAATPPAKADTVVATAPTGRAPKSSDTIGLTPAASATPSTKPGPATSGAQPYSELPFGVRKSLPELKLSMHVYAGEPSQRFVVLNDSRLTEGEKTNDEIFVREIRPDGVVLEFQNQRFFYPRDGL